MTRSENLTIGSVAQAASVNVQTLRYYEREGLLAPQRRTPSGYRVYAAETIETVRAIKRAQALGFTLRDIRQLMTIRLERRSTRAVAEMVTDRIRDIDARMRDLRLMRRALKDVVERCQCGGDLSRCDVLTGLGSRKNPSPTGS